MTRPGRSLAVVVTTISDGAFLTRFADAAGRHGTANAITVYVIGDLNTPPVCAVAAARLAADGFDCRYLGVPEQEDFLAPFPALRDGIPHRSDNRRNVGYLLAFRDGHDVVISMDDDNLPRAGSAFFADHALTGTSRTLPVLGGDEGWANICALLDMRGRDGEPVAVYPRGFPYAARGRDHTRLRAEVDTDVSGVNIGLWTGDPDVDAPTRLVTAVRAEMVAEHACFVARGQRTPVTSQNTSIVRAAVPAYYYWRMGQSVGGMKLDRYGDMFSGYCVSLCAEAVGHRITAGTPYVHQARNDHNLYKDIWNELPGMILMDDLRLLLETPLSPAASYVDAYLELAERLVRWADGRRGFLWDHELPRLFHDMAAMMGAWVDACRALAPAGALAAGVDA